jgi:hypothetical protein
MTQSQTIPTTRPWITARLSLAALFLASVAIVLSVLALTGDSPVAATTPAQAVAGHPCAWVAEVGPDWLPGIGAESTC